MNYIDILILILIGFGLLLGFKRGVVKQLVSTIGLVLVIIISFLFKNPLSSLFYKYLPFFKFEGNTALNLILYEFVAFALVFTILFLIFKILVITSSIIEKLLNATVILGIHSKILGAVVGVLEYIVVIYVVLFYLTLPVFNIPALKDSYLANLVLTKTTFISSICNDSLKLYSNIDDLKNDYGKVETEKDKEKVNTEMVKLLIEYKVTDKKEVENLVKSKKLIGVKLEELGD